MKRLLVVTTLFISVLCPTTTSDTQMREAFGGTILLFYADKTQVFVAADSRLFSNGAAPPTNDGCKIISLSDDTIFFYSGGISQVRRYGQLIFSANDTARAAFKQTVQKSNSVARLTKMANIWASLTEPTADAVLSITPADQITGDVQLGGFAGLDENGIPHLILANMSVTTFDDGRPSKSGFSVSEWPVDIKKPLLGFGGTPSYKGAVEFLRKTTPRAKAAYALFEKSYGTKPQRDHERYAWLAAMRAAVRWAPDDPRVGGKVDSAVLEANKKVRWLSQKTTCRENQ